MKSNARNTMHFASIGLSGCLMYIMYIAISLTCLAAWLTHVITCIQDDRIGFLIAGAIAAPIGVIHGIGIWFGAW